MDCVELMNSLSLADSPNSEPTFYKSVCAKIDNTETDIIYADHTNKLLIFATQYQKLGALLSVTKESIENSENITEPGIVYTVRPLLGVEVPEQQAAARYIAEQLNIEKQLCMFLCLKQYRVDVVKALVDCLRAIQNGEGPSNNQTVAKRAKPTTFGQMVIGPPGSGKTTYCAKVSTFYLETFHRTCDVINLDPANDNMTYNASVDVMDLITVRDVMSALDLGPNGALIYCMEYLEANSDWLLAKLAAIPSGRYLLFDLPGQVELYTHHNSIRNIFQLLEQTGYQLCVVHMVDAHYCSDASKFISTLLLSLSTMLHIALPHVNVLSKADQLKEYSSSFDFGLDFYTDVLDLEYLLDVLDSGPFTSRFKKLNKSLVSLIEGYSLVSFIPFDVSSDQSIVTLKNAIDKANGYVYGTGEERSVQSLLSCAVGARTETERYRTDFL